MFAFNSTNVEMLKEFFAKRKPGKRCFLGWIQKMMVLFQILGEIVVYCMMCNKLQWIMDN